jgi:hypothetical protein
VLTTAARFVLRRGKQPTLSKKSTDNEDDMKDFCWLGAAANESAMAI